MTAAKRTLPFNILKTGHVELRVTDLDRAHGFYVGLLGLNETERIGDRLFLRCLEDWEHHSLILRQADRAAWATSAIGLRAKRTWTRSFLAAPRGLPARWVEPDEEPGQGRALRISDPMGFPVEFYHQVTRVPRLLQSSICIADRTSCASTTSTCTCRMLTAAETWYADELGFRRAEYTETEEEEPRVWATWLHRKQNVHDVALMTGPGPRLHHVGFWTQESSNVLRAADILSAAGYEANLERGPGRHGISNAMFLYLLDPDGNRIELYTSDYLIPDPDFEPIRWR